MPLEQQKYILLCWDPPPSGVELPPAEELKRMPVEDLTRLMDEMERPGRDALLPYAESLPMAERIQLLQEATRLLPPSQIWRLKALRFACRPDWKRRLEGRPDQPHGGKPMGLKHRLDRLEKDAGVELCGCPFEQIVIVYPSEPDPPPPSRLPDGSCPTCGGRVPEPLPRIIIRMPRADGEAMKPLPAAGPADAPPADVAGTIRLVGVDDDPRPASSRSGERTK